MPCVAQRRAEADEFYEAVTPPALDPESAMIMRRALAGMLWSKQFYYFDLDLWLREHEAHPLRTPQRADVRNQQWFHMQNGHVLSMPDCWEYPWYAAWDLAFHCVPLSMVDPTFTRDQIELMISDVYLHPSGQIPAYEWNFGDVNPPGARVGRPYLPTRRATARVPRTTLTSCATRSRSCC